MKTKIEAVLEKITKLRALAKGATTQGEMEAASRAAERLIAEYQIEEAQLIESLEADSESIEEHDSLLEWKTGRQRWLGMLAGGLADLHGCFALSSIRGRAGRIRIAGRASDVAIVKYLFGWLRWEIELLAQRETGRANKHAFRLGAVMGVLDAMKVAQRVTSAEQGATGMAMVLVDRAKASEAFLTRGAHIRSQRMSLSSVGAYDRGKAAGSKLQPRAGIGGSGVARPMLNA